MVLAYTMNIVLYQHQEQETSLVHTVVFPRLHAVSFRKVLLESTDNKA